MNTPQPGPQTIRPPITLEPTAERPGESSGNSIRSQAFATGIDDLHPACQEDVTIERVEGSASRLGDSEVQFRQLVAGVTDYAIFMLDADGCIMSWNSGAERIKGYCAEEIIGRHFSCFYTAEDRAARVPDQTLATAARVGRYETQAWRVRKDGSRFWANVVIDAIRDQDGRLVGFAKVTRDMTERRALEEQLHQSQKMEAIGQLTGGVAHDFNNLLTVIAGNLELISRHLPATDERLRRAVDQAALGAERAATLTQQLLAFARRQPLNPKPIDVNELVAGMSSLLQRTLAEQVVVDTVFDDGLWLAEVDPHQLESALLNLAVNARDAMPEGGTLTIETANIHYDVPSAILQPELPPGDYVSIVMRDTGVGMDEQTLARAFEPFYTTKPLGHGTGLGLSQVYGFVTQSGGRISMNSSLGHGTTLQIWLPRFEGDAARSEYRPRPAAITPAAIAEKRGSETILVVEDDSSVRLFSADVLRELGYKVIEAADGAAALRAIEQYPEVSLLFTDVGLPGMNGRQLADQARQLRPHLPILFTSGYARNVITHDGRLDPDIELLTKPFTHTQLAARIREMLDPRQSGQ